MYKICSVCNCPQFKSPSGMVCKNGHGGADHYIGEVKNYYEQYQEWFREIKKAIDAKYSVMS